MEKIDRNELKAFTKENFSEERKSLAQKIKEERKGYFNQKQSLLDEISNLEIKIDSQRSDQEKVLQEMEDLRKELAAKSSGLVKKIWNHFGIKKLEKRIEYREKMSKYLNGKIGQYFNLLNESQEQIKSISVYKNLSQKIEDYYSSKEESFLKDKEEKEKAEFLKQQEYLRSREIKNIVKKHQVVFVHGIHPKFTPAGNSLIKTGTSWQAKADIVLSLEPTISTSTIKEGDTKSNMWSKIGFVLASGNVVAADFRDTGSIAQSLNRRKNFHDLGVDQAIIRRSSSAYNDLTVDNPNISGFYFCRDRKNNGGGMEILDNYRVNLKEVYEYIKKSHLPFYLVENGVFFRAEIIENDGEILISKLEKVDPEYFINNKFELGNDDKDNLMSKVLQENIFNPYKFTNPDWSYVSAFKNGFRDYTEFSFLEIVDLNKLSNGEVFYQYEDFGKNVVYSKKDGRIIRNVYNQQTNKSMELRDAKVSENKVRTVAGWINLPLKVHNIGDYLKGVEQILADKLNYINSIDEAVQERCDRYAYAHEGSYLDKDVEKQWMLAKANQTFKEICFTIYGFAEQAEKSGAKEISERVKNMLSKYIDLQEIQNLIKDRLDANGNFRVKKSDLE